jgi:hypothetical protein
MFGPTVSPQLVQKREGPKASDPALLPCPGLQWLGPFPSMASMNKSLALMNKSLDGGKATKKVKRPYLPPCIPGIKRSHVRSYEKAVQDFTETARRLARLNQHFRQASFAEFEMLMVDDEVLKRYGLPKPMVERALIEVYQTVVLDQQRWRDHS